MNNSRKIRLLAASAVVPTVLCTFGLASTTFASTNTTVEAVKPVYLRSSAHLGYNTILREPTGTVFTVESGSKRGWWHVVDPQGNEGYVIRNTYWVDTTSNSQSPSSDSSQTTASDSQTTPSAPQSSTATIQSTSSGQLPPGVTMDSNITPIAPLSASAQDKFNAILSVAQSKLGTPYEWGHNEDRGQYGFDCSNFTSYVYHHALGYHFSGASRVQASSVGWDVPISDMQPGDLLIFNDGSHVGIYIGNDRMIQEGGGLAKVGYLSVAPGTYWGNHITAVKRMF